MSDRCLHILFRGREYLVQEEATADGRERVTVFMRFDATDSVPVGDRESLGLGEGNEGSQWLGGLAFGEDAPGDWEAALVHVDGEEEIVPGTAPRDPTALKKVLRAFLGQGKPRPGVRPYYMIETPHGPAFRLARAHLAGLALLIYSDEEGAAAAAGEGESVGRIDDIGYYLIDRAREGFVGGMLDDEEPIYFFLDDEGQLQVLRLVPGDASVEPLLLGRKGSWFRYEGDLEMDLLDNQEAADRLMVERLGPQPFLGHRPEMGYLCLPPAAGQEGPGTLRLGSDVEDEVETIPILPEGDLCQEFLDRHGLARDDLVEVGDLHGLIRVAQERDVRVVLLPGEHRALQANLWVNGDDLIFDSYSGFWSVDPAFEFTWIG